MPLDIRSLFHFPGRWPHGCGLSSVRINADQRDSPHSAVHIAKYVTTSSQVVLHVFGQAAGHGQASQFRAVLTERADEMFCGEARRPNRLLGSHAEDDVVENDLNSCLILLVSTRYRDRHHRMVVMKKQRRA